MDWKRLLRKIVVDGIREKSRQVRDAAKKPKKQGLEEPGGPKRRQFQETVPTSHSSGYPGDFRGHVDPVYDPHLNGLPDPGEIVWTWVPYEEDFTKGKDRPVLLIGRDEDWLLGLQVSSQDHDRDAAQEARAGRYWTDIGSGDWDRSRRPSTVRVNRILRVDPDAVRRIGAVLDEDIFDEVAREVVKHS